MRMTGCAIVFGLVLAAASASANDTFMQLAGQWRGDGMVNYSDGTKETLHCRASYDVLKDGTDLQLSIRCASAGYKIDLIGSAKESGGRVSGTWSEANRNVAGSLSGTAQRNRVHVLASSSALSATLDVVTTGAKQIVTIRSQDPQSTLQGATLSLQR
jgi:hypothetical protein